MCDTQTNALSSDFRLKKYDLAFLTHRKKATAQ